MELSPHVRACLWLSALLLFTSPASAGILSEVITKLPAMDACSVAWGDYDNDGDLDVALAGHTGTYESRTCVYRNDGGAFIFAASLTGALGSALAWGDYDNDGDLDLVVAGYELLPGLLATAGYNTILYRNDAGAFVNSGVALTGVELGSVAWGDYDNDGDLDLALAGYDGAAPVFRLYRNDRAGGFTSVATSVPGVKDCDLAWADYDADGDLDLAISGDTDSIWITRIYRNDGSGIFTDAVSGLSGRTGADLAWGDYDADGRPDLAVTGARVVKPAPIPSTSIYHNNGDGTFSSIGSSLTGLVDGCVCWGDYDNDGDLDLAVAGYDGLDNPQTIICKQHPAGSFADAGEAVADIASCSLEWGDYDNDRDLDLLMAGYAATGMVTKLYRNAPPAMNAAPSAPAGLSSTQALGELTLSWSASTDDHTPAAGLTYNIRVGTKSGDDDALCGMANTSTGLRRIPARGNAQQKLAWTLRGLPPGKYYWSVQALDASYVASAWSDERHAGVGFSDTGAGLPGLYKSSIAWGDYDNDGDMDFAVAGMNASSAAVTKLYKNNGAGGFAEDVGVTLPGVYWSSLAWGDCNGDGYLDLALAGSTGAISITKVFLHKAGGGFTECASSFVGVYYYPTVAWADADNDGDLDLLVCGHMGGTDYSKLYLNNGSAAFSEAAGAGLPGVRDCSAAWGDYDKDGDLDLAIAGYSNGAYITRLYKNYGGGSFAQDLAVTLPGVRWASLAWGDCDNDGDLDLALMGDTGAGYVTRLYRNGGAGAFTEIPGHGLPALASGSLAWGDYDNDGDSDLVITGWNGSACDGGVYANNGSGIFTKAAALTAVYQSGVAWADFDNDGDLDLGLTGTDGSSPRTILYRNNVLRANTAPVAPTGLSATVTTSQIAFQWSAASDSETPAGGLTYNLRVGTYPGKDDLCPAMSLSTGRRLLPAMGNTQKRTQWTIKNLPKFGKIYWSVQTVDAAFAGSSWTSGQVVDRSFQDIGAMLAAVTDAALAWGDFDDDGDLDLALCGELSGGVRTTRLYKNNGGSGFSEHPTSMTGVSIGALAWGDYDRDGDLDLALCGYTGATKVTRVYRNTNGSFALATPGISHEGSHSIAWGDYDNDGDLDLAVMGLSTKVFRNDGGSFLDSGIPIDNLTVGKLAWGDYDNDGDLDLLTAGSDGHNGFAHENGNITHYRNDGAGNLVKQYVNEFQPGRVFYCDLAWADYDNDGDLDFGIAGRHDDEWVNTEILINNLTGWTATYPAVGVWRCGIGWGDCDNDGLPDLAITGLYDWNYRTAGVLGFASLSLTPVSDGQLAWGDYNSDGRLDLAIAGMSDGGALSRIYRNIGVHSGNTRPSVPGSLSSTIVGDGIRFQWTAATDSQTSSPGLSYNLRVGSLAGGNDVFSGMAHPSGTLKLPQIGNAQKRTSWLIKGIAGRPVVWSVQAIDPAFGASLWSAEALAGVAPPPMQGKEARDGAPVTLANVVVSAVFPSFYYVESEDRSWGIRVYPWASVATNQSVTIMGIMRTNADGERYVEATSVSVIGTGGVDPLVVTNAQLGGADWHYDPATGAGQHGVTGGTGLNNLGLLITTTGKVTYSDPYDIYIDDGSRVEAPDGHVGVRVHLWDAPAPQVGKTVKVTGISSVLRISDRYYRYILLRSPAELVVVAP